MMSIPQIILLNNSRFFQGKIPRGLPHFEWPNFSDNGTSFFDMVFSMGSGVIVIPLISLLETISLCKTFGKFRRL
jgi:sodium-independent sulfate anion transporter 11